MASYFWLCVFDYNLSASSCVGPTVQQNIDNSKFFQLNISFAVCQLQKYHSNNLKVFLGDHVGSFIAFGG